MRRTLSTLLLFAAFGTARAQTERIAPDKFAEVMLKVLDGTKRVTASPFEIVIVHSAASRPLPSLRRSIASACLAATR